MEQVNRASARAGQFQILAEQANDDLRIAAHHLALTVRAMIKFYGIQNINFLLRVPPRYKKVFSAFIIQETRKILDNAETSSSLDAAALRRFGDVSFGEDDKADWLAVLEQYKDVEVNPGDVYNEETFVGFLAPKLTPEDLQVLEDLENGTLEDSQPVASSSKVTLD
jgi:hypothetical protein